MSDKGEQKTSRYKQLGKELDKARGIRSQEWLAEQTFVAQAAVCQWLNGFTRPRPDRLGHLAALLKLNLDDLIPLAHYECDINAIEKAETAYRLWCSNRHL